jgi:hypothetical protein
VTATRSKDKESITIFIRGVPEGISDDRFAYLVYHAVKGLSRDVTVAKRAKKEGVADAEPVSRSAPERSRR